MPARTLRIFGALDIVFGWIYLLSFIYVVPPYSETLEVPIYALSFFMMAAGAALLVGKRWSYWLGVVAAGVLGVVCLAVVSLLIASAAYLYGLYGAFGKGATYVTLFAISLVVTWFGLLPIFQLWGLLRRPVRSWALETANAGG
jgi:hypothetical protein